ncbi:MAG: hypothetical protein AAGI15_16460 [Pseudomonadota bacterium]
MSFDCKHCRAARGQRLSIPVATFEALLTEAPAGLRFLKPERALAALQHEVDLSEAVLTTTNGDALASARAPTLTWSDIDLDTHPATQTLTVSCASWQNSIVAFTPGYAPLRDLDVLHVYNRTGSLQHRIIFGAAGSAAPLANLPHSPPPVPSAPNSRSPGCVDRSLQPTINARAHWHCLDAKGHLEAVRCDGGRMRRKTLPRMGKDRARAIDGAALPHWLAHLYRQGVVYTRIVAGEHWMQADASDITGLSVDRGHLLMHSRLGVATLALSKIDSCWHTRFRSPTGPLSFVEVYSSDGQCLAVLAPYRNYLLEPWNALTASIPNAP